MHQQTINQIMSTLELLQETIGGLAPACSWHGAKEIGLSCVNKFGPNRYNEISRDVSVLFKISSQVHQTGSK